jgi:uncharacterized linocin/CFP29 family protein
MFARAADIIARVEDAIVFNGVPAQGTPPADWVPKADDGSDVPIPKLYRVRGGTKTDGLLKAGSKTPSKLAAGGDLVEAVIEAIRLLEQNGHYGPFACVLGHQLFSDANKPYSGSGVLPSERITRFLNGPLLRSSTILPRLGVVVALAGNPVDLVIATDINVRFLQLTTEPRYVFRVSERMALRVKQPEAVSTIQW